MDYFLRLFHRLYKPVETGFSFKFKFEPLADRTTLIIEILLTSASHFQARLITLVSVRLNITVLFVVVIVIDYVRC